MRILKNNNFLSSYFALSENQSEKFNLLLSSLQTKS